MLDALARFVQTEAMLALRLAGPALLGLALLVAGCGPSEAAPDAKVATPEPPRYPTAPDDTEAVILQRTACNGRCPMYSVGVTSNGNVHFFGEKFTKKLGYAFTTIPRENVTALNKFVDA